MKEDKNTVKRIWNSIKRLFIRLFGFGKKKRELDVLEEEALMSPGKIVVRNFLRNKLAVIGIVGLTFMLFITFIMAVIIPYDENYTEGSQVNLPPNLSYLRVPNKLEKEGVRLLTTGNSFSLAISNDNNLYAWGSNIENIKKDFLEQWKDYAPYIKDISAGNMHAVALVEKPVEHVWRQFLVLEVSDQLKVQEAKDGSVWYTFNEDPADDLGNNGDYYLNTVTRKLLQKEEGAWTTLYEDFTSSYKINFLNRDLYISSENPEDNFGQDNNLYLSTQNEDAWIIFEKVPEAIEQQLLFLGDNSQQQSMIPIFERDPDDPTQYTKTAENRLEREAIARYFDSEYFLYHYVDRKNNPTIDMELEFANLDNTSVTVKYKVSDLDSVMVPNTLRLYYGTKSAYAAANFFRDRNTLSVDIEVPEGTTTFEGEITIEDLIPDNNYQFTIAYSVYTIFEGEQIETTNNIKGKALYTSPEGKVSATFRSIRQEINGSFQTKIDKPIIGNKNDPIKKVLAGHNITCVLTESGQLYTWGSTNSLDDRLGNTIQNIVPIVDFTIARMHVIILREDNSVAVYGNVNSAISLDLRQRYRFLQLSADKNLDPSEWERTKAIDLQVQAYRDEITYWEGVIPTLREDINERIENARADYDAKYEIFKGLEEQYKNLPDDFVDLDEAYEGALLEYNNMLYKISAAENLIIQYYEELSPADKLFVDSIEDKTTLEDEYTGDWDEESSLALYASEQIKLAELNEEIVDYENEMLDAQEEFFTKFPDEEERLANSQILDDYIDAKTDCDEAQEVLNNLKQELYDIDNKVNELNKAIEVAESQKVIVEKIAATTYNAFFLTSDNQLLEWGSEYSDVGKIPDEVQTGNIQDIDCGLEHIVLLTKDGTIITWGSDALNQLDVPHNLSNVTSIKVDRFQNYAFTSDGKIVSWGNSGYLFGTDGSGRSLLQRIIIGGRVSMIVGLIAVIISVVIGTIAGLISGFYGGWVDMFIMRFGEVVMSFPFLPLAITLSSIIGNKMPTDAKMYLIMVILGVLSWPGLARLIRGQILSEREKDFVTAARALGIKEKHIMARHILPNVVNIIIVSATLGFAGNLLTEAGLSFLGFGVVPPKPSWGNLLTSAQDVTVITSYWWQWILPAVFIIITALSINLIGDGLREAMDPKANER